jgi:hypothetical protein
LFHTICAAVGFEASHPVAVYTKKAPLDDREAFLKVKKRPKLAFRPLKMADSEGFTRIVLDTRPTGSLGLYKLFHTICTAGDFEASHPVAEYTKKAPLDDREAFLKIKKRPKLTFRPLKMADSEGFEPPVGLTLRLISSQVH